MLAERLFREAKAHNGKRSALLLVDEAHNFIPERTTGFMAEAKDAGSLTALTTVAVEGRKFAVGLVVVSQRPSRIAKDVLAQMNSQIVFRLANLEDLGYVRESFEAAGESLMETCLSSITSGARVAGRDE